MKKLFIFFVAISFVTMPMKISMANNTLFQNEALKILQLVNSNIASYNIKTHVVTFKDGSKPICVTPKGEKAHNGEILWNYFISHKGEISGWLIHSDKYIISNKSRMVKDFNAKNRIKSSVNSSVVNSLGYFPHYSYVECTPCPQQHWNWCGPAATQATLSTWGKRGLKQADITSMEKVPPDQNVGANIDLIASTLNYYINEDFYKVDHWGYNPKDLWNIFMVDIGYYEVRKAFIAECDTNSATPIHTGLHSIVTNQKFYAGITYTRIDSDYKFDKQGINSFYNAALRWQCLD